MFNVFELLFILSLDDESGGINRKTIHTLEATIAGAILAELALQNRIQLLEHRVVIMNQDPTDHPILDKVIFDISDTAGTRKLKYWINTLIYKKYPEEIGHHLVMRGVLLRKKERLYPIIPYGENSDGNPCVKYRLKNNLREIILADRQPDLSEKVLLIFLYHGKMLKLIFTHDERWFAQKRINKLVTNNEGVGFLSDTLDEIVTIACEIHPKGSCIHGAIARTS